MQIQTDRKKINETHPFPGDFLQPNDLFLDIETTGLSRRSSIYLIGMAAVSENMELHIRQLFAETPAQEAEVLQSFSEFLSSGNLRRVITFNGSGFDLPFLAARANTHGIPLDLEQMESFDIYKEVLKLKHILQLQNYKQKTIEQFLGCGREDQYSGGELIKVYEAYGKTKDPAALRLLLLHNYEDVLGMAELLPILSYQAFFAESPRILHAERSDYTDLDGERRQELILTLQPPYPLPGSRLLRHPLSDVYLALGGEQAHMRIPLTDGQAKLYYPDHKNYYYLPAEDMAVHKSVASYVDRTHRQKATPANCYTKIAVTDAFLHSPKLTEYAAHVLQSF
jgi:hypothetical protein